MSFQAMTWAINQKVDSSGKKLVLLMMANYCNSHTGQCNPSHKRLAEECSMGISTLKNHIASLEKDGFLTIQRNAVEGVSLPNQYHLNIGRGGSESGWGVGQNLATNLEVKPVIKPKHIASFDAYNFLLEQGAKDQLIRDWLKVRKAKKASDTETSMKMFCREVGKTGLDIDDILSICIAKDWKGFEAEWLKPKNQQGQPITVPAKPQYKNGDKLANGYIWMNGMAVK